MRHMIVLAGEAFELVTSDRPFEDDEARCIELAATNLRQLEQFDEAGLGEELRNLATGPFEFELERVLVTSLVEATVDYETGLNGFECLLELRPLVAA